MSTGLCPKRIEGIPVIPVLAAQHLQSRASITSSKNLKGKYQSTFIQYWYINILKYYSNIGINSSSIYSSICHCI